MQDCVAVFMCNLKPAKMRGILSEAMIMCASTPEKVEILIPPTNSQIGDRVTVAEYPGMSMLYCTREKVEILIPPTNSQIGDRVTVAEFPGKMMLKRRMS